MTRSRFIAANLRHRPLRTGLAISSFGLMSAMFVTTVLLVSRTSGNAQGFPNTRVVAVPYDGNGMPRSYVEQIRDIPGAKDVEYQELLDATEDPRAGNFEYFIWAVSDGWPATYPQTLLRVPASTYKAWRENSQAIMAADSVAEHFHWKAGSQISVRIDEAQTIEGTYVGSVEMKQLTVICHYDHVTRSREGATHLSRISIGCEPALCNALSPAIDRHFENSEVGTFSMPQEMFIKSYDRRSETIPQLFLIVGIAIVAVCGLVVTSSLLISLRNRSAEFATLRVLGFRRAQVFAMVVGETVFAATIGGIVSSAALYVSTQLHPVSIELALLKGLVVSLPLALEGVAFVMVLGALVSIIPTIQSLGRPIVTALVD